MELKRKFYEFLKAWKSNHKQECLLVKGARQVGKTYLVEKLGREEYESFIEFNFILDPTACGIFDGSLKAEDLQVKISAFIGSQRLIPGKTLIFIIVTIVGAMVIIFLALTFFSLLSDALAYFVSLYREIVYRLY